jgi:hypothetical protein
MINIQQEILGAWSTLGRAKTTPSGWVSGNAVCCHHNGESRDTRGRGGMICEGDGVAYHCFNCHYKASWKPGRKISFKMRNLLEWMGMADNDIVKLCFIALGQVDTSIEFKREIIRELPTYESRDPCPGRSITSWLHDGHITERDYDSLEAAITYLNNRGLGDRLDTFYWTNEGPLRNRVLVPFTWQGKPMGYSGRLFVEGNKSAKYLSNYPANMLWGYDLQRDNAKFSIVVEGLIDAVCISAIGICGNEISETQATVIDSLNREVIVVPDRDAAGKKMVEAAINYGWNVAFPDWGDGVKDVADSVAKYGNLFTMRSILNSVETSSLKIKLISKKWNDK